MTIDNKRKRPYGARDNANPKTAQIGVRCHAHELQALRSQLAALSGSDNFSNNVLDALRSLAGKAASAPPDSASRELLCASLPSAWHAHARSATMPIAVREGEAVTQDTLDKVAKIKARENQGNMLFAAVCAEQVRTEKNHD